MTLPFKVIDLTHTLTPAIPTWDGGCGFEHMIDHDYDSKAPYKFRTHKIHMNEGIGTHMDAPAHSIPGGKSIADLDLETLVAPCVKIDVSHKADERYSLTPQDIEEFEHQYGTIQKGSFVIVYTGWERFWNEPEKYRNSLIFPSISKVGAELLLKKDIVGLGIDTLSPDRPDEGFPVHQLVLGTGKYIVENVANSHKLPPLGSYSLTLPLKIQGGTEAPLRLVGLILNRENS